jgi:signal peptidase I
MTENLDTSTEPIETSSSSKQTIVTSQPKHSRWGELASTVIAVVAALGLAVCLIAFVFQSYQVDGPSMETTLENNDRLIVWKIPRTWARITRHAYVPKRGDVVIFNQDNLAEFGQTNVKQLVKRVVGLPGDRVVIGNGHITIYNKQHNDGFDPDATLPYGKEHVFPTTSGNIDITLSANQVFVCGDNRTDSLDSRAFGPVSLNHIVGKLVLRIYPLSTIKRF